MKSTLFNTYALSLVGLSLIVNVIFLFIYNPHVYFAITQVHGQVGYNLINYASVKLNPALSAHIKEEMQEKNTLIDFDQINKLDFEEPTASFPINDTVGYGVLLGFLWKITHSFKFFDIQIMQIIIFSLLMLFYYQVALLLFGNRGVAFLCGIAQLLFFPLIAYNLMPVRDVWAYYGLLMLVYGMLSYLRNAISKVGFFSCLLFFIICLWMRPTLFLSVILATFFLLIVLYKKPQYKDNILYVLVSTWITCCGLFWVPFMKFNMDNYNRYVVSPAGQSMLEGLGEIPNKWGHALNDEYVRDFIGTKYGLQYGTPEFDEVAMQEFKQNVREEPLHYLKTLLYRLPDVLLPGLQWIFYAQSPYAHCVGIKQKLVCAFSSFGSAIRFLLRQLYMRLYLIVGYIGLFLLWRDKKYTALFVILICLLSGLSTFPSHIEYRYIVPFYWVFSFGVGYAIHICKMFFFQATF
ncbi:MAG: hypothetical protein WD055_02435 [Candidatus Dependentiae bacterium]